MKKNATFHLRFLALLLVLATGVLQAENGQALLWRLETPQGAVSHLFGTIHSEDPRVLALAPPVSSALDNATTLALEMDLGEAGDAAVMGQAMALPADRDLKGMLGADLYHRSLEAMAGRGYPESVVSRLQPWAIVLTLSMPQPKTGLFLDYVLYLRAVEQGKEVVGLEQLGEQLDVFTSLSMSEQISLLRDTLREYDEFPRLFDELLDAYLQRDLQALASLSEQGMRGGEAELQQRLMGNLVDVRNRRMASRLLPLLQQGGVFAAVGALHLPGDTGLLALLRRQGVRVSPIY